MPKPANDGGTTFEAPAVGCGVIDRETVPCPEAKDNSGITASERMVKPISAVVSNNER